MPKQAGGKHASMVLYMQLCRKYAWGHDELMAQTHNVKDWFGVGLTIVDSLDTLIILGLKEEYQEARSWVANHLDLHMKRVSVRGGIHVCDGGMGMWGG